MKQKETQIGPYEIKAKIGQGGTSVVYRAVDTRNQRVVALKVLTPLFATDPKFLSRFINEGRNVKRLDHPNIVQVYDADAAEGRQYIAMELVEGGSLSELIKNRNTLLPTDEALNIIEQIASALDYAHGLGILHRDIKLSNVLLTQDDRALLTDFGSAKHMYGEHTIVTQSGFSVGTPTFMSPEQAKGDPDIDRRTDVYSLGVAAFAILVGRLPFKADSQVALLHKIIYDPPPLPEQVNPEIAPGIAYALKRVLSKDPPMRYSTAGEFAAALIEGKSWVPGTQDYTNIPTHPHGTGTFFVPQQHVQKSRGWLSLAPLLLLLTLGSLALIFGLLAWLNPGFQEIIFPNNNPEIVAPPPTPETAQSDTLDPGRLKPVVLTKHVNDKFALNVPDDWLSSTSGNTINFDSPEFFARLFVQQLDDQSVDEPPEAVIDRYLGSVGEIYRNPEVIEDSPRTIGSVPAREQILTANWLGRAVTVRLIGLQEQGQSYVIGSIVGSEFDPLLSNVLESVADSFTINQNIALLPSTVLPDEQPAETPSNEPGSDAPTPSPSDAGISNVGTGGTSTAITSTSIIEGSSTGNGIAVTIRPVTEATESTTPAVTQEPTSTGIPETPTATLTATNEPTLTSAATDTPANTSTPQPTLTPTATDLPANTSTPQPTATELPANTATTRPTLTPTATDLPATTATPRPTATELPANTATTRPTLTPTATDSPATTATPRPTLTPTATETSTPAKTATELPTERPTNTQTNTPTPRPTQTPVPTETSVPTETPTTRPTATGTPTSTPTNTATDQPTATPTRRPTETSAPTSTNTVVPTSTSTSTSTVTAVPPTRVPPTLVPPTVAPPTRVPAPPAPPAPPASVPASSAPISGAVIQPISPAANTGGGNRVRFEWLANFTPGPGQGFELVFWRPGQTPIENSFGLAAPTTGTNVSADLASLDNTLGDLLDPGDYQWGILLVQQQPYQRVQYLGGGWQFTYVRGSAGSSSRSPSSGE